jgi:acetyl-CoA carboxylase biotin carboxylase subunit
MPELFRKIFIANRGEIACRAIRTCKELGIEAVAGYSESDRLSKHVHMADESVFLGPSPSQQSYLNIERVIQAAVQTGCDAVYPGYGFLAENATFAEACENAGLAFIGPSADVIRVMGDKEETRRTFKKYGIPVVPGLEDIDSVEDIVNFGNEVGWPVLLKAAAGGGGKGMEKVNTPGEVAEAWERTRSIATKAFGDGRVYVEKFIERSRHIEYQFVGDQFGNAIHLGERECSIQRHHQKLIEEAPSVVLSPEMRKEMGDLVVNAVSRIGYVTAGTMEFIYDPRGDKLYAIEVNTRIQVEHTVTEMISGLDLIRLMIETRAGFPLPFKQEDVSLFGHALECRINAEDPKKNFLPSAGPIQYLRIPSGPFVRLDSGVYQGWTVPVYYDSMLAKLCVFAVDRKTAIQRMLRALNEFELLGVKTTVPLHKEILKHPEFQEGNYDTFFIDDHKETLMEYEEDEVEILKIAKLLAESSALGRNQHCF